MQNKLIPYTPRPGTPSAVICDIDGTLALHQGRGPFEYERCGEDAPNPAVVDYLQMLSYYQPDDRPRIILLSGRPVTSMDDTMRWLARHDIPYDELHMRKAGDYRKDVIVKGELFDAHIRDAFNVRLVLDDRNQVVRFWRDLGLPCWQVNDGNF